MRALKCSPEFSRRQHLIEEHDLRLQEEETPELVEDDDLGEHLFLDDDDDDSHPLSLINALVTFGVSRYDAINAVSKMTSTTALTPTTFCEVYGRGAIVKEANAARRNLNIRGLRTFDLRVQRDDGEFWDLSKPGHRRDALRIIEETDPDWVICGPPCTVFSALNYWMNYPRMSKEAVDAKIAMGLLT